MMSLRWQPAGARNIPHSAFVAGHNTSSRENVYIARTTYDNGMSPGKALNSHDSAYISYNGKEVPISSFDVLMAENPQHQPRWQSAYGGNVPEKSVLGGYSNDNEPLYIARAKAPDGGWCPGKLHPSHRVCYIPWGGKEHGIPNYEVLVLQ